MDELDVQAWPTGAGDRHVTHRHAEVPPGGHAGHPALRHRRVHAARTIERPGRGRRVGVLAVQGAFRAHARCCAPWAPRPSRCAHRPSSTASTPSCCPEVSPRPSPRCSTSTTSSSLWPPPCRGGLAALGTCAGMILLARRCSTAGPTSAASGSSTSPCVATRFGTQLDSFETDLDVCGLDRPFPAVFIRAPVVTGLGDDVEVLARLPHDRAGAGEPVLCRQGPITWPPSTPSCPTTTGSTGCC